MPQAFQFTDRTTGLAVKFPDIDDAMRREFGEPPDPDQFLWGWYDTVCESLCMLARYDSSVDPVARAKELFVSDKGKQVLDFLDRNYIFTSWRSI